MAKIDKYLKAALALRASDIHFCSGEPVRARVDGDLTALDFPPLETKELLETLFEILSDAERQRFNTAKNLDKSYVFEEIGFFRVNIFNTRKGVSAVLRAIPQKIPTPADLGLPAAVVGLTGLSKGLVLVTGPTGSGKSTTLAALIGHINKTYPYHVLTAEDPVEFVHESQKCLINQREIGNSCPTFADALKYALREDPDVILVGEMRDLETIALALTAAETGHLVFGTLHTRGAAASVDRIIDSFPANQQAMIRTMLAESLVSVISQSLLKRADKTGRVAAYEIMVVNHAIANLIREGKTFQIPSMIQTARKEGMVLMDQYILDLVNQGIVAPEEAAGYLEDSSLLGAKAPKGNASHAVPVSSAPPPAPKPISSAPPPAVPAKAPALKPVPAPAAPTPVASAPAPTPAPTPAATPTAVPAAAAPAPVQKKSAPPPPPPLGGNRPPAPAPNKVPTPVAPSGFKPLVTDLTEPVEAEPAPADVSLADERPDLTGEVLFEAVEETQLGEIPDPKKKAG